MPHPTSNRAKEIFFIIGGLIVIAAVVAGIFYLKLISLPASVAPGGGASTSAAPLTPQQKEQLLQTPTTDTGASASATSSDATAAAHAHILQSAQTQPSAGAPQLSAEDKMKLLQSQH